jgi:hypothetical protein
LKKAFSLFWALGIILIVSTLMVAVVKISSIQVEHTTDSYLIQRAQIFLHSVIENSILAIEGYKRENDCLEDMIFRDEDNRFEAKVKVLRYYCYDSCPCSNTKLIQTSKSHGYVLLKIIVYSTDNPKNGDKRVYLERITLQRP